MSTVTRIFDILDVYKEKHQKNDALTQKVNKKWQSYSSDEYVEYANLVSCGLLSLGFKPGDKIATVSNNRPEWNFLDMGMSQIGVIHIPIYPTIGAEEYEYILKHSESKTIIISDKNLYKKIKPVIEKIDTLKYVFTINKVEGAKNWNEIIETGKKNKEKYLQETEQIKQGIQPADLATIIYTSGTTGKPKGVMLSHNNLVSNFKAVATIHNFDFRHRTLSFLPLCHVFERMVNYHFQWKGVSIYYAENMGTIGENLKEVKPHVFITVPRLLENVYDKIITKGKNLKGIKRIIFHWAVNLGLKFNYNNENGAWYHFKLFLADKLVFKKWREALGNNTGLIITGGAALQPRLSRVFGAAGIPALEGYGLTETSPVIAVNNIATGEIKVRTVGPVLKDIQVKIDKDGEILVKGPNIMMGYYKNEELTKQVIDDAGWFHTGDIGKMVDGKFLQITDRKKEIFKLSSGKYIAPQAIENKMKESFFIEQAMVIGENEKFASALISPNFKMLHNWAAIKKLNYRDNQELISNPRVVNRYQKEINEINQTLGEHEKIKRFKLLCEEWSNQTGELSPTLKLKRKYIFDKYQKVIEKIYRRNKKKTNGYNQI